jgi:hypothetical protein
VIFSTKSVQQVFLFAVLTVVLGGVSTQTNADQVILNSSKDNTLFEESDSLSNGAGSFFFVGQNGSQGGRFDRRGLIAFDIDSFIPAGSIINSVQLDLNVSKSVFGNTANVALHRVSQDWGEGTSNSDGLGPGGGGGVGATATAGDATWRHTFSPGSLWNNPGGDFTGTASASRNVGGNGSYTWSSTASLVADVQNWLDNPTTDFGWMLLGDEATNGSAKRFNSRENVDGTGPKLTIDFTPIPEPSSVIAVMMISIGLGLKRRRTQRF